MSRGDGSHMTTVGSAEVKEYEDLGDDWLPDLDSSSGEEDLESCECIGSGAVYCRIPLAGVEITPQFLVVSRTT